MHSGKNKAGYAAIVGKPNSGKSTLLNSILGENLSIVTPKPQTTRYKVFGIYTSGNVQIVFVDTPGMLKPKYKLQHFMKKEIESSFIEADIILLVIDASAYEQSMLSQLYESYKNEFARHKIFCVLNKIDLITKETLLQMVGDISGKFRFAEIIPVSAITSYNIPDLLNTIIKYLPEHEFYYEKDTVAAQSVRFFTGEIIREQALLSYGEEIPYSVYVEIDEFKERESGKTYIRATVFVDKESQKKIVIGTGGSKIKQLGERSRKAIESFLGKHIYLDLHVKVNKDWKNNEQFLRRKFSSYL